MKMNGIGTVTVFVVIEVVFAGIIALVQNTVRGARLSVVMISDCMRCSSSERLTATPKPG
jgi:hypothetical protein